MDFAELGMPLSGRRGRLRRLVVLAVMSATLNTGLCVLARMHPGDPVMGLPLQTLAGEAAALWIVDAVKSGAMLWLVAAGHRRLPAGVVAHGLGLPLLVLPAGAVGVAFVAATDPWLLFGWMPCATLWRDVTLWETWIAALLVLAHEIAERGDRAAAALHESRLRDLRLAAALDQARAQLLQAQIEPHFLFNSLANARRLLRTDAPAARAMLDDLLRYLREALPRLRETRTTLGGETELVRAFLAVHQVRMGRRLKAEVDVPPALHGLAVPPMVLLTLVENALKHGVQPMPDGAAIRVDAHAENGTLTLTVSDTGRGMGDGLGHGTGLVNTRARLRMMFGASAGLSLKLNEPRGTVAVVRLPEVFA